MDSLNKCYKNIKKLPYKMFITLDGKFICNRHGCNYIDRPGKFECECLTCQKKYTDCICIEFNSGCAS